MKVKALHIDGFGMFADYRIDDLSPGLTVVHGPNEAGKSTLVAFVMSVLFGFADGRSKGPRHEPRRGGQHGGRLILQTEDGDYIVERTKKGRSPVVTRPDGTIGGEQELRRLLGGADRRLFRNIFAFSLHELEEFGALQDDAVRERIFATPTFGGGRSPGGALKELQALQTTLLKPRAASTIGELIAALQQATGELQQAQAGSKAYPKAVADTDHAARVVDRCSAELDRASNEAARYQRLIDVWPDWSARSAAATELGSLATPEGVTPAIADRLDEVRQQIKQIQVKVAERRSELERLHARRKRLVVDDDLPPVAAEVKTLYAGVGAYDADSRQLGELNVELGNQRSQLARALADLGPEWSQERVEQFDASIPTFDEVSSWRDRLRNVDDRVDRAAAHVADLTERLRKATEDCTRIEQSLGDHRETPEPDAIESADGSVRRLRGAIADAVPVRQRAEAADARRQDRQRDLAGARRANVLGVPRGVLIGLPVGLVVGAVAAGGRGEIGVAVVLGLLAAGFVGGLLMPGLSAKRHSIAEAEKAVREAEAATDAANRESDALEQRMLAEAAELGFDEIPSQAELEERLGALARQRSARASADALASRRDEALVERGVILGALREHRQELSALRSESEEQWRRWDAWRNGKGIAEQLSPEAAIALFPAIKATREVLSRLRELESRREGARRRVTSFEETAGRVLEAAGRDGAGRGAALAAALDTLHSDVIEDEKARADLAGIEIGIRGAGKAVAEAEGELEAAESARRGILAEAGVSDEASLEKVVAAIRRRIELEIQIAELARRIDAAIGTGAAADEIRREIESGDLSAWRQRRAQEQRNAEQLQEARDQAVREHQDQKTATERIAASADVATRGIEVEGYRRRLTDAIGEWERVVLARSLIERTLSKFEQDHQPRVVTRAAALFETITAGRYPKVVSGEAALGVVTRDGKRIDVVDLSTGTVQQLYLCLRFALAEEFAEKGTPLPLLMDDVLVNFDPERAARVAQVIAEVSTRHQVLLFTCHVETRALIEQVAPDAGIVELDRYAG